MYIYICTTRSLCSIAEINKIYTSTKYTSIKKEINRRKFNIYVSHYMWIRETVKL